NWVTFRIMRIFARWHPKSGVPGRSGRSRRPSRHSLRKEWYQPLRWTKALHRFMEAVKGLYTLCLDAFSSREPDSIPGLSPRTCFARKRYKHEKRRVAGEKP